MTEGEAINAAWIDHCTAGQTVRPMSELTFEGGHVWLVGRDGSKHYAHWDDFMIEWAADTLDEDDAVGWLPA